MSLFHSEYSARNVRALESESQSEIESENDLISDEEECSIIDLYDIHVNNVNDHANHPSKVFCAMQVQQQPEPVHMQVDCGASCNVLPDKHLPAGVVLKKCTKRLRMYSNHAVSVLGTCKLHLRNPKTGKKYLVPFHVVDGDKMPLLGSSTAQQMQLITVNFENIACHNITADQMLETESDCDHTHTQLRADRKRTPGTSLRYGEKPLLHLWKTRDLMDRSQTTCQYQSETTSNSPQTTSTSTHQTQPI